MILRLLRLPFNYWHCKRCNAFAGIFCERTAGHFGKHKSFGGTRW